MHHVETTPRAAAIASALLMGAVPLAASGGDGSNGEWPHWRGPERNGISRETGWMVEGRPEPLWSKNVGLGYSSVTVRDGRLFTMGHDEEKGLDTIWCLNAETGQEVWTHSYPTGIWNRMHGGGTLSTPSIDGDVVYTVNREGAFFCFEAKTGEIRWSKALKDELNVEYPTWGFAASPLVLEDVIVLNLGKTFALDKSTGKVLWESLDYGHAYSTPTVFVLDGKRCLAVFDSRGLGVLDLKSGKELHFHEWKTRFDVNAASPVLVGDKVFISSGLDHGCALLEIGEEGIEVLWENKVMRNKLTGCVLWEDHLYGFDEAIFKCMNLDGEEKWRQRGLGSGAFMVADGKLIIASSEGELIIAEATPDAYQERSRAKVLDDGVYWTSPVLVNGLIYVRNSKGDLVCRDHRADTR